MGVNQLSAIVAIGLLAGATRAKAEAPAHDFIDEARALLVVGACADGAPPAQVKPEVYAEHCTKVRAAQVEYRKSSSAELRDIDIRSPENSINMYFECFPTEAGTR